MRHAAVAFATALLSAVCGLAGPAIRKEGGLYVLENELVRAEVKRTELHRLVYKPTGRELMSPTYHGVVHIVAKAGLPHREGKEQWLIQDSFASHPKYAAEASARQATLTVTFDWARFPGSTAPCYEVEQQLTLFAGKPCVRIRYRITAVGEHQPFRSFYVGSSGTRGTHLVEPCAPLRVEPLGDARLGGLRTDPASYWFAYWDKPTGHFAAVLRPGQTDPSRCMFTRDNWYVARWSDPFPGKPGQSHREELWIAAGKTDGADPAPIARAAADAYAFVARNEPIRASLHSPYVTFEQLVARTRHLRADGKGTRIAFRNERLYVDGKPFLLFAPWGVMRDHLPLYRKYHLTGLFGPLRHADVAAEHGLMLVGAALEWPRKRGAALEEHIRSYASHPAILAWFLQDDFGGDLSMLANIEIIRKVDPHRPTVADVVGYDADRRRASAFLDINAPYTYPAPIRTYRWYADYLEHNLKNMERQFNWTCPQARTYSFFASTGQPTGYFVEYPTAAQMRLQTYVGLAHGIRGFMYWPCQGLIGYKLSELGILCLEVEPLTPLIVEANRVREGAAADNEHIEVQRIDHQGHTLLFLIHHRPKSERWPTGELSPKFTVTLRGAREGMRAYSMTLDDDLAVAQPRTVGDGLALDVAGLDVAAMVLVTADARYAAALRQALGQRRPQAAEFAATTNKYMAGKVHKLLTQLGRMQAPMGRAAECYGQAVAMIGKAATFTGQRRAARMLRRAMGEALAEADGLRDYAPAFAQNSILINAWKLPQFMASFDFRRLRAAAPPPLAAPPAIAPMGVRKPPPEPKPLAPATLLADTKGKGSRGYRAAVKAGAACCLVRQAKGGFGPTLHASRAAYDAEQSDFVGLPNDNLDLAVFLFRPDRDTDLHVLSPAQNIALGFVAARPMRVGQKLGGPRLSAHSPVAVYETPAAAGDSFEAAITPDAGCVFDLYVCQAHPRHAQALAYARAEGGKATAIRATLPDPSPLVLVVERVSGDGAFRLATRALRGKVAPQKATVPFRGLRFALYGKPTNNFPQILAAHGIAGDKLDGRLAGADLSRYNAIVVLTNAVKYDEAGELRANAGKLKRFVHGGGRLVVFQQNGRETWNPVLLPYRLELAIGRFDGVPVLADERLFAGLAPGEFRQEGRTVGYYPIKVAGTASHWHGLAYTDKGRTQALAAACAYGKGKVVVNQFAVLDRIGEPVMRRLMVATVRYALEGR